ncbi:hypothetical protein, partial [Eikenella corrodens]|uniref:hypothetical protein n=1 Tax=Eikenella corrodens TaxID=539 RepID=UPI00195E3586
REIAENLCLGSGCQRKGEERYFAKVSLIEFGALGIGGGGKEREKAKYFSHGLYLTDDVMITNTERLPETFR